MISGNIRGCEEYGLYQSDKAICKPLSYRRPMGDDNEQNELKDKLERLSESGIEYTQTFLPQLHMSYRACTLTTILNDFLKRYKSRYVFELILIGEYSKTGMYHLHGSIKAPPKMINSLRRRLPKEIGRAELKPIRYVDTWVNYCFKDEYSGKDKELDICEIIDM